MSFSQLLATLRERFGYLWLVLAFGAIYLISQVTIGVLLEHVDPAAIGKLQVSGFTASSYIETFTRWEASGVMAFYRAHFVVDGIHWLWYTLLLLSLLSLAMKKAQAPAHYNALLVLPMIAGPCDALENSIQKIFLSEPGYVTIVDPLPMISTLASITKWSLVAMASLALVALVAKALKNRGA